MTDQTLALLAGVTIGAVFMLLIVKMSGADIETRYIQADEILCDVLKAYGHHNLVNEFDAIDKDYG